MPPDINQPIDLRSSPRAMDVMDDHIDWEPDDVRPLEQYPVSREFMIQLFEAQQDQLGATLTAELNKRLPLPTTASDHNLPMVSGLPNQAFGHSPGTQQLQEVNYQLLQQIQQLQQENKSLQSDVSAAQEQNNSLTAKFDDGRRDLSHERAKNEELRKRMASLRQMLIPSSEVQISDNELQAKFTALRVLIHRLVRGTWALRFRANINHRDLTFEQRQTFRPFLANIAKWKTLHNHMRSWVFIILDRELLSRRHYGLSTVRRNLAERLDASETYMWGKLAQESRSLLMDWRIATMKVTGELRDHQRSLAREVQRHIWAFLAPVATNGPEAEKKGGQLLEKLCNDAFDLSLMIQQAKDHIYVNRMAYTKGRPISEYESMIEEEASEAVPHSGKPQTITYILDGALQKDPKENPKETITMEKAQAVVYE